MFSLCLTLLWGEFSRHLGFCVIIFNDVQYRPEGLQHLCARKMRVKEGPYARVTRKLRARNFLRALLHTPQLHANCVYFEEKRNPLLFIHALCVYFSGSEVKNVAVGLYHTCNSQAINLRACNAAIPLACTVHVRCS